MVRSQASNNEQKQNYRQGKKSGVLQREVKGPS